MVDIINVVNVQQVIAPAGLGFYNVNNVMVLADEVPIEDFGSDEYRAYVNSNGVKNDWGSESKIYKMAISAFSQNQSLLSGNGQLLIAPMTLPIPAAKATGSIQLTTLPLEGDTIGIGSDVFTFSATPDVDVIEIGADIAETVNNIANATLSDATAISDGVDTVTFTALVAGSAGNSLDLSTDVLDAVIVAFNGGIDAVAGELLKDAITRLYENVYFGMVVTTKPCTDSEYEEASDVVQTLDCKFILSDNRLVTLDEGGLSHTIINKGNGNTKCVFYSLGTDNSIAGAYVSLGASVNYEAQNSCITMHLKDLSGFLADPAISQTVYNKCKALGVDCFGSIEGLPKLFSFSANGEYFDESINRLWFIQRMKVEVFNVLATTPTKIPQTERGMNSLKNSARAVCDLGVYNGFLAPNKWNGVDKFGNIDDFDRNILESGYYVYSAPISQQTQTQRETREAPVIQIAAKQAGAIHSSNILIYFER